MRIKVKYLETNDASGKYRWWFEEWEGYGQFEHANSMDEIIHKARTRVTVVLEELIDG